ncbi:MAG: hypothetical protein WC729_26155 [Sphingomonas sp.]|uniref:hypothetical protein n=1 Tax=Sphingomonas sp. TaxID=28214 RepID=UPI003561FDA7
MRELQAYDQKLVTIGYRLQVAAHDLCGRQDPLVGIAVQDLAQYEKKYQAAARREFGFEGYPEVLAVAAGSPFDVAGVRADDSILAIDDAPVAGASRHSRFSAKRVAAVNARLDASARDGVLYLRLRRDGIDRDVRVVLERGCATRFQTAANDLIDASADGKVVEVDTGVMRFAGEDAEIAAVVAHELAHNILLHQERLLKAGVRNSRGARNARLTRVTEEEADRLAVYLLDRAGYSTSAIVSFWQRLGEDGGGGHSPFRSHSVPAERIAIATEEMARIAAMRSRGEVPRPAFLSGNGLPPLR